MNIVRASQFETLNFTALSKYTAGGSLQLTSNLLTRSFMPGAVLPGDTFGPNNAQGILSSSFDLGSLENSDFYSGLLSAIDATKIHFLLSSGLPRELIMHAAIDSIEVKDLNGDNHRVYNDPTNDVEPPETSLSCGLVANSRPYIDRIWIDKNDTSCLYQKFRYFLKIALQYGVTTEAVEVTNPSASSDKNAPKTIVKANLCLDSSLAIKPFRERLIGNQFGPRCGRPSGNSSGYLNFAMGYSAKSAVPSYRSTLGIFYYLGKILREKGPTKATLVQEEMEPVPIFPYNLRGTDCFVAARGVCIENTIASANAKQMIGLLNALIALSIKPSALPITPTVQLSPG